MKKINKMKRKRKRKRKRKKRKKNFHVVLAKLARVYLIMNKFKKYLGENTNL
jgi:hypothetical protein